MSCFHHPVSGVRSAWSVAFARSFVVMIALLAVVLTTPALHAQCPTDAYVGYQAANGTDHFATIMDAYAAVPEIWFQAAFGHLTGYQAGYYGYQWSLVYACDMFQRFEELGMLDPKAGSFYRRQILARGGTMDAAEGEQHLEHAMNWSPRAQPGWRQRR